MLADEARLEAMKVVSGSMTILTFWFSILLYVTTYCLSKDATHRAILIAVQE